jgi:hypothetical protein
VFETRPTPQFCNCTESSPGRSQRDSLRDPRLLLPFSHLRGPSVRVTPDSEHSPRFSRDRHDPVPAVSCAIVVRSLGISLRVWGNQVEETQLSDSYYNNRRAQTLQRLRPPSLFARGTSKAIPSSAGVVRSSSFSTNHHDWPEHCLALLQGIPARTRQKSLDSLIAQPDRRPTPRATPTLPD